MVRTWIGNCPSTFERKRGDLIAHARAVFSEFRQDYEARLEEARSDLSFCDDPVGYQFAKIRKVITPRVSEPEQNFIVWVMNAPDVPVGSDTPDVQPKIELYEQVLNEREAAETAGMPNAPGPALEPVADPLPDGKESGRPVNIADVPAVASGDNISTRKAERRKHRDDYKAECKRAGVNVTDLMIAEAANPHTKTQKGWNTRDAIQKWLQCDPKYDGHSDRMIRDVFKKKPHLPKANSTPPYL